METRDGVLGVKVKARPKAADKDASGLRSVAVALGKRWKGGLIVTTGKRIERVADPEIWAVPSRRLFQQIG